jgi:hypothetical protein
LSSLDSIEVFDANVIVGDPRDAPSPGTRQDLLTEMGRCGVHRALVHHVHAATVSPRMGHEMLIEFIGDDQRLVPQVCVLPDDESFALLQRVYAAQEPHSVRLAWDGIRQLLFTSVFYGPLLAWLEARQVTLFVPIDAVDLRDLADVSRTYPSLPLVVEGAHYTHHLWLKPLLRSFPRLSLELSRYEVCGGVEELALEFGAERFLYGSAYPRYAMGPVLHYLAHCAFTTEQRALICGGNVSRLL